MCSLIECAASAAKSWSQVVDVNCYSDIYVYTYLHCSFLLHQAHTHTHTHTHTHSHTHTHTHTHTRAPANKFSPPGRGTGGANANKHAAAPNAILGSADAKFVTPAKVMKAPRFKP